MSLQRYKKTVRIMLFIGLISLMVCGYLYIKDQIPDEVLMEQGGEMPMLFHFPVNSVIEEEILEVGANNSSDIPEDNLHKTEQKNVDHVIRCSLLGILPLKTVEVKTSQRQILYPGGYSVGIYLKTKGILVIGTGEVQGKDGQKYEPAGNQVQTGDYIVSVNGTEVADKEELVECIHACGGNCMELLLRRDEKLLSVFVNPILCADECYKAGIWVRNDAQGVGTLTYTTEDGHFGALGHGISDVDTDTLLELEEGALYDADVVSITKGKPGTPGELAGIIHYTGSSLLGAIEKNCSAGIFGTLRSAGENLLERSGYEIAYKQEAEIGPAVMRCSLGSETEDYEIEIESISLNKKDINKGMTIKVTDQRLLDQTGGIIQGLSGSPIIQNGKLVGAVTHVFVNDPTKGYGIFAETMLEQEKQQAEK